MQELYVQENCFIQESICCYFTVILSFYVMYLLVYAHIIFASLSQHQIFLTYWDPMMGMLLQMRWMLISMGIQSLEIKFTLQLQSILKRTMLTFLLTTQNVESYYGKNTLRLQIILVSQISLMSFLTPQDRLYLLICRYSTLWLKILKIQS